MKRRSRHGSIHLSWRRALVLPDSHGLWSSERSRQERLSMDFRVVMDSRLRKQQRQRAQREILLSRPAQHSEPVEDLPGHESLPTATDSNPIVTPKFSHCSRLSLPSQKLMAQHVGVCTFHSKAFEVLVSVHKNPRTYLAYHLR